MGTISISEPSDGQTIDAADVNNPLNTIVAEFNGNIDDNNIKTGANINGTKLLANSTPLTALDAQSRGGWIVGALAAPNTITYNGNRNYSVVFNSVDYSSVLSNGMRLKLTRTVTAPTQCTSLNGSTQYYSKTSPAGMTGTDDYTFMAWVKISSYANGTIIDRTDSGFANGWSFQVLNTGQVRVVGLNASNNRVWTSPSSLPLNKWVHVAASLDMSGNTSATNKVYYDGVDTGATLASSGTPSAWVNATDLHVGAQQTGGITSFFPGKIAQAAVFSAVLSQATIQSYISQTLSGSETSLISAYSFNNVITDLNTTNANNLTANGSAVATNADSPFAGGANASTAYTAGTTEFGEVFNVSFSTNTTVVVQVPDGYAIPTSGGVSAAAYSTTQFPLGWAGLGTVIGYSEIKVAQTTTSSSMVAIPGLSTTVYVPASRKVKLSVFGSNFSNNGANTTRVAVFDGSTQLQIEGQSSGTTPVPFYADGVVSTTGGSKTYTAQFDTSGGTMSFAAGDFPFGYIKVELV